jgi:hypothetical protein
MKMWEDATFSARLTEIAKLATQMHDRAVVLEHLIPKLRCRIASDVDVSMKSTTKQTIPLPVLGIIMGYVEI